MNVPPRSRSPETRDLPKNLYKKRDSYVYRHPITGKCFGMGTDKRKAVQAALELNHTLIPQKAAARLNAVIQAGKLVPDIIAAYKSQYLPRKKLTQGALNNHTYILNRVKDTFPTTAFSALTVGDLADYLNKLGPEAYRTHRRVLVEVYRFALSQGEVAQNVADSTLPAMPADKQRKRLSLEQFNAIYALAGPWMQTAMDLALLTLQGRLEVSRMKYSDIQDGWLYVTRQKTKAHMRIRVNGELQAVIDRSRDNLVSPLIVHRDPDSRRRTHMATKSHWTAVTAPYLSKEFARLRDECDLFADLEPVQRPTFHEIRSLGTYLYEQQCGSLDAAKALLGHRDEKMTEHYRDGHAIEWQDAEIQLSLKDIHTTVYGA